MRYFLYLIIIGFWFVWFANVRVMSGASYIADDCYKDVGDQSVGIVLGARVVGAKVVEGVYADRLQTVADLYKKGKITKILVSGDHGQVTYDEVTAGKDYLLKEGILSSDIFLDHAGFDTYDSIYRAKNIFKINKALIITQDFHLPRALYLSHKLNIEALGCRADLHDYQNISSMKKREILARVKAWLNITLSASPKYKGEIFDITGNGEQTWDQLSY